MCLMSALSTNSYNNNFKFDDDHTIMKFDLAPYPCMFCGLPNNKYLMCGHKTLLSLLGYPFCVVKKHARFAFCLVGFWACIVHHKLTM